MMGLFDRCVDPNLLVRRITVVANHIISENDIPSDKDADQPDLFTDYEALEKQRAARSDSPHDGCACQTSLSAEL